MRSLNIGIFLLLISILICVKIVISENGDSSFHPIIRTKRETTSINETIVDSDESDDADDNDVIYVCGDENSDQRCKCFNETLDCNRGLDEYVFTNDGLQHSKIKIRNKNFTAKFVNFHFNKFKALKKAEVLPGHESNIEELYFYYNDIETIESWTFDKFTSLKKLGFEYNALKSINETILTKQLGSTLVELDLSGNNLQNLSTNVFQFCTKLTSLNLKRNKKINLVSKINGLNVPVFPEALENLRILDLSDCNIQNFDENVFINLRNLEKLEISGNPFSTAPKAIKVLSTLQYLDLSHSEIVSINDCDFCNFPNLKLLLLSHSYLLSNIHENAFGALNNGSTVVPQLEKFSINNCNISTLSEKLLNWKNVSFIDIRQNPLTCNCSLAWLINDYNASTPQYIDKLTTHYGLYKNDLKCHHPRALAGTHLHTISGDFCENGNFVDDGTNNDGIYYVCGGGQENTESLCNCYDIGILTCSWSFFKHQSKLNHTNVKILISNVTFTYAEFNQNNITSLKKNKVIPGHENTVTKFWLSSNKINFIENGTFDKFTVLEELYLDSNNLTNIDYVTFPSTLKYLYLENNFLQHIPTNSFDNSLNLITLDLSWNQNILSSTKYIFPKNLTNLKNLKLHSCNISNLDDNVFINLRSLETISLARNPLTVIPTALNSLSENLQSLYLYENNITVLQHNNDLKVFKNLTYFYAAYSNFERIEDCAFCNFPNLKSVNLHNNRKLSYIHENAFGAISNEKAIQLEKLDIEACNISTLSEKLLDWKNVSNIDILQNPLTCNCSMAWFINDYNASTPKIVNNLKWYWYSIKDYLRCHNPQELKGQYLHKLSGDFCLNETETVEEEKIYQVCGEESDKEMDASCSCENESLKCNSLGNTNIAIYSNKTVEINGIEINFGNISHLNLKKLLPGRQNLIETLQFYHSNISSIENGTFDNFTSLKALDLTGNLLTTINETILTKQIGSTLIELDLNSNQLNNLSSNAFMYLTKLKNLKLNNNMELKNSFSSEIFSKSLASLEHLDLSFCNITSLMDNVFVNLSNLTHLTLSHNSLTTFPIAINSLSNLRFLDISNTEITVLKKDGIKLNKNLKYFYAYSSKIQKIEECAFCNFPNLKEVDLHFNKELSYIHENAFGFAHSHISPSIETFLISKCNLSILPEKLLNWNSLKHFAAGYNPFICDCSMTWLIKFIKEKYGSIKLHFYNCATPEEFAGKTFAEVPETFCNETLENTTSSNPQTSTTTLSSVTVTEAVTTATNGHLLLIIFVSSLIIIMAFVITVGGISYYRNKKIIQISKYEEGGEDLLEEDFDDNVNV